MRRWEWAVLALLIGGVAALEIARPTDDPATGRQATDRVGGEQADPSAPRAGALQADPTAEPGEAFRTVRLHVTGMT